MPSSLDWGLVQSSLIPLLQGLVLGTIPLTAISFVLGLALALLVALARISRFKVARYPANVFVSIIRGTPLLVQLFIIFFGLPGIGIVLDPWPSAILAFTLNVGAYASESIRGAILGVSNSQWEAAFSVGLNRLQALRRVILPQAARTAVPPLSNTLISLVKDTSLASAVLVTDLLRRAQEIAAPTFQFFLLYGVAAIYYWVVSEGLTLVQRRLERRLARQVAA